MSDNQPDFERMSQEEIMAWMESLAKRQGATEGFTTSADVEIAEIDPDTAVIDEPGYVPYSEGKGSALQAAAAPPSQPPQPRPVTRPVPPPATPPPPPPPAPAPITATSEVSALAWLESLAANQNDSLFNLDLSALEAPSAEEPEPERANPQAWLQDIARGQGPQEGDTVEWLETLAVRQGAAADEIITPASAAVPRPGAEAESPAYAPFSFETAASSRGGSFSEPASNPADFLSSLSAESGYSEAGVLATQPPALPADDHAVISAISSGTVTPEQMLSFMERQMDRAMETPEPDLPAEEEEGEAAPVRAEIPDWLIAEVGPPPAEPPARPLPPIESILPPAQAAVTQQDDDEVPDWLSPNAGSAQPAIDMGQLLLQEDSIDEAAGDTWAEAFDTEYLEGAGDVNNPPEWYLRNIEDPERNSRIASLIDVPLPHEADLAPGSPEPLPDWMETHTVEAAAPAPDEEDVPSWITVETQPEPEPEPEVTPWWEQQPANPAETGEVLEAPIAVLESPPLAASAGEPALERARQFRRSGELAACLAEYDALVRSGVALDAAVDDLAELVSAHRNQPTAYRVLGDGYMRQGQLQRALDVYREALNLL
jgi:hypothetical protein